MHSMVRAHKRNVQSLPIKLLNQRPPLNYSDNNKNIGGTLSLCLWLLVLTAKRQVSLGDARVGSQEWSKSVEVESEGRCKRQMVMRGWGFPKGNNIAENY